MKCKTYILWIWYILGTMGIFCWLITRHQLHIWYHWANSSSIAWHQKPRFRQGDVLDINSWPVLVAIPTVMFLLSSKTRWVGPYHFVLNENFPTVFPVLISSTICRTYVPVHTLTHCCWDCFVSLLSQRETLFHYYRFAIVLVFFFWEVAQTDNSVWSFGRPGDRYMGRKYSP